LPERGRSATYAREQSRLAGQLKRIREDTGLSGNAFAKKIGWQQSKVSRIENAKQLPTDEDVRQWTKAAGVPASKVKELLGVLHGAVVEYVTHQRHYHAVGGAANQQMDVLALEARVTRIGEFQPAMIPGLLQTAEYAAHVLGMPCGPAMWGADQAEIDRMVATRMERQQQALYRPGKRIEMVVLEAALRSRIVPPPVLAGQLDRLIAVSTLPTVEFGVIPFSVEVPVYPISGFAIFDTDLVVVESLVGEQQITDPQQIASYDGFLKQLLTAAAHREQLAEVIQQALAAIRGDLQH
jgi:transcriptional regulator with XRE-family HTH domain